MNELPLSGLIIPIFFITVVLSFVTAADSMTSTVALISVRDDSIEKQEAPGIVKIAWALLMGLIAWLVVSFAKIDGIKMVATIAGIPAAILVIAQTFSLWKMLRNHVNEKPKESIENREKTS